MKHYITTFLEYEDSEYVQIEKMIFVGKIMTSKFQKSHGNTNTC